MATFMTLPREIRDEILGHALQADIPAPENPAASRDRKRIIEYLPLYIQQDQPTTPRPSGLGLLLANRQLHAEALPLLEKHDANPELDVMYVRKCGLWPTWTRTPLRPGRTRFDTLRMRFRIFEAPNRPPPDSGLEVYTDKIFFASWNQSPFSKSFFAMLQAFLQTGTRFAGHVGINNDGAFAAKALILDVLVPEDPGAHRIMGPMSLRMKTVRRDFFLEHRFRDLATWPTRWPKPAELREERIPSEKLAYFMWTWLQAGLLCRLNYDLARELYSGFGSIEIKVDGKTRTASDLSRWLALHDKVYRCPEDYGSNEYSDDPDMKEWADENLEHRLEVVVRPARERRAQRGFGQKEAAGTEKVWGDYDVDGADDYGEFIVRHRRELNGTLEEGGIRNS
ncbi:hypothetical protein CMUS01_08483 [Colletotrichum musicola]|uniref:Uncharacterized protein n=1 Tax=Colletotrichum musicola TaxID=2175873 RepID=A0A8H6KBM7_9PEZI|nr:hypothetical protein CMUS01_08483 [Colletotrichum musicola]